jgi:hypothetical protein
MLLLTTLFTVVAGIFIYSLRADTGKHTKHARAQRDANHNKCENAVPLQTHPRHSSSTDSARAA